MLYSKIFRKHAFQGDFLGGPENLIYRFLAFSRA
jgi:hypothetical protein